TLDHGIKPILLRLLEVIVHMHRLASSHGVVRRVKEIVEVIPSDDDEKCVELRTLFTLKDGILKRVTDIQESYVIKRIMEEEDVGLSTLLREYAEYCRVLEELLSENRFSEEDLVAKIEKLDTIKSKEAEIVEVKA
ncbi:MAG: hypothetical protein DRM97_07745, partial [Thermoprotei archaeon]